MNPMIRGSNDVMLTFPRSGKVWRELNILAISHGLDASQPHFTEIANELNLNSA